ncbi:MAG: DUF262 domain-containing protein [Desulfobulbaceae bacterium]|nr:DUF262 domain-containing protein [Desulfobulbaceae bacterium]
MKSDDLTVLQLFKDRRQYMVPFYQRSYVWTLSNQWSQLWDDIRVKAESRLNGNKTAPHFLGAVVLDPQPRTGLIGVDTLHIIDGQQRLTTLQFVLKSVLLTLRAVNSNAISQIISGTLTNNNPDTMRDPHIETFKVWPTFRDRKNYRLALESNNLEDMITIFPDSFTQKDTIRRIGVNHPPPLEAIWYFTKKFIKWVKDGTEIEIPNRAEILATSILQDLKIVSIILGEDDDAQIIFETLNGRGAQLHATDLIRNFIFMRADREGTDSEKLYNESWSKFESGYWNDEQRRGRIRKPRIEWFIHASLQAELQEEVDLGRLYFEYRRYVFNGTTPKTAQTQLDSMSKYAVQYKELVSGEGTSPIARFGLRISPYDITTLHPLALLISVSPISDEYKEEMYGILVSYVVRRAICGLTAKNYNNVFLAALRNLSKSEVNPEVFRNLFSSLKGEASRWPKDEEFKNICMTGSIYPGRLETPKMRAILAELELGLRQASRTESSFNSNLSNLDIDHILPKSWYTYWPLPDGTIVNSSEPYNVMLRHEMGVQLNEKENAILARENIIPTLGNLTLLNLSVNREAQHKSFQIKKDLLLANTHLRLNIPLLGMGQWDEASILKRGELMADIALKVWPGVKAEPIA